MDGLYQTYIFQEIFDIRFIEKDLYKFGSFLHHPDEIRCEEGTYCLWLNVQSRDVFHKELRKVLANIPVMNKNSPGINSDTSEPTKNRPKTSTKIDDQGSKIAQFNLVKSFVFS